MTAELMEHPADDARSSLLNHARRLADKVKSAPIIDPSQLPPLVMDLANAIEAIVVALEG